MLNSVNAIHDILRELTYNLTYPFVHLFVKKSKIKTPVSNKKIIFVMSWFNDNPYHIRWVNYMIKNGIDARFINFKNMNQSYSQSAEQLDKYIRKNNLDNYYLVGISNGGLICLSYLNEHNKWESIKLLILLGVPIHGTLTSVFLFFTKKGREMMPGSEFINNQLKIMSGKENKIYTISAKFDEIVDLKNSQLDGADNFVVPVIGHNNLHLGSRKAYDLILKIVNEN